MGAGVSFGAVEILALFFTESILVRHAPRIPLDHEHDLVFHIKAAIVVYVFGSDYMTAADVDHPSARPSRDRLGDESLAELETLPVDAGRRLFGQNTTAGQRELLKIGSIASARSDSPFRQMLRDEFGRHIKPTRRRFASFHLVRSDDIEPFLQLRGRNRFNIAELPGRVWWFRLLLLIALGGGRLRFCFFLPALPGAGARGFSLLLLALGGA